MYAASNMPTVIGIMLTVFQTGGGVNRGGAGDPRVISLPV